jgi:hypothetical protein
VGHLPWNRVELGPNYGGIVAELARIMPEFGVIPAEFVELLAGFGGL